MKFYRYIIYRLYSIGLRRQNDTPALNVILTLSFVHFTQLFTVYIILLKIFPQISIIGKLGKNEKIFVGIFLLVFGLIHLIFLFNKERWNKYVEEFKNELPQEQRKGSIKVYSYLVGSIVLPFLVAVLLFR
jgi:hypothetical protein